MDRICFYPVAYIIHLDVHVVEKVMQSNMGNHIDEVLWTYLRLKLPLEIVKVHFSLFLPGIAFMSDHPIPSC